MKISNVIIDNFRSIEKLDLNFSTFNILIGQNNTGKTNFFEAINWFYTGAAKNGSMDDLKFQRDSAREISVGVEFSGAQHGAANMINEGNRTKILNVLSGSDAIKVFRKSTDPKKRIVEVNGSLDA